jgi:hypothetical protein
MRLSPTCRLLGRQLVCPLCGDATLDRDSKKLDDICEEQSSLRLERRSRGPLYLAVAAGLFSAVRLWLHASGRLELAGHDWVLYLGLGTIVFVGVAWTVIRDLASAPTQGALLATPPSNQAAVAVGRISGVNGAPGSSCAIGWVAQTDSGVLAHRSECCELTVECDDGKTVLINAPVAICGDTGEATNTEPFASWAALFPANARLQRIQLRVGDRVELFGLLRDEQVASGYRERRQTVLRSGPGQPARIKPLQAPARR